ncbi:MAG: hypothetical protein ACI83O_000865 [Patescibacteria group bacterium]|jgi:hypothetical protein
MYYLMEEQNNAASQGTPMTPDQEVAFHQGALNTLLKEKEGLMQMVSIVEATIQGHVKRMQELGVQIPTDDSPAAA